MSAGSAATVNYDFNRPECNAEKFFRLCDALKFHFLQVTLRALSP